MHHTVTTRDATTGERRRVARSEVSAAARPHRRGNDLTAMSASALAAAIRSRELSPSEVVREHLAAIDAANAELGAFLHVGADRAREAAKAADRAVMAGDELGPLHGVPFAVKDIIDAAGVPTTCGSPRIMAGHVPDRSSPCVDALESAGAILLGKLHCTEFACIDHHPDTPPARNPWAVDRSPGGSSSGSAIAAAANLVPIAIGTDTVASIRLPAAWCGVVGLKPTWGSVSTAGVFPLAATLDHVGPIARSVSDAAATLDVIGAPTRSTEAPIGSDVAGVRVGWDHGWSTVDVDAEVAAAAAAARDALEATGARIVDLSLPPLEEWVHIFSTLFAVEIHHAHRSLYPHRSEDYSPGTRLLLSLFHPPDPSVHVDASLDARRFRRMVGLLFADVDVILSPPAPVAAQPLFGDGRGISIPVPPGRDFQYATRFTSIWDLGGNPAITIPWGLTDRGLPLGVQLAATQHDDARLLRVAAALEACSPPLP
jgi:Asp-tRNA(Asn)/Glu-tRNA(Gln) amidotransferase A subunit family amidase